MNGYTKKDLGIAKYHFEIDSGKVNFEWIAYNKLTAHGITVIRGCHGKVDDVLRSYQNGELQDSLESCDHHDCTHHEKKPVYVIPSFKK